MEPSPHYWQSELSMAHAYFLKFLALIFAFVGLAGILVLGLQVYAWLATGTWQPASLLLPLAMLAKWLPDPAMVQWIERPDTWIGLHKVLDFIPLSLFLMLVGLLFFIPILHSAVYEETKVIWAREDRAREEREQRSADQTKQDNQRT